MLDPLGQDTEPGEYDLCLRHAARCTPPSGWALRDRAPSPEPVTEPAPPVGPDRGPGVARLAAALSAVQRAVSEDALDAAPVGTDRPVAPDAPAAPASAAAPVAPDATAPAASPAATERRLSPLDGLLGVPQARVRTVPLSERTPEVEVRSVPQPLRLAPDPTTTVWCADLLAVPDELLEPTQELVREPASQPASQPAPQPARPSAEPTLFA